MTAETDARLTLRADCGSCVGLCCVALPFARSADFAIDKPAGMPCPHLRRDDGCEIHADLRAHGFAGCVAFDCFGAGQQVTQVTFGGASWRAGLETAPAMFAAFETMQALHELRWYLAESVTLVAGTSLATDVDAAAARVRRLTGGSAGQLARADLPALRADVASLLRRVSATARASGRGTDPAGADLAGADLAGRDLTDRDLRGADLRGALLIGADLRGVDLGLADLLGADMRGADVRGADLGDALFLTPRQVSAGVGDAQTRIPVVLTRPSHWA